MGTGKSTVGRLAADQLQFKLVDTDEQIVARAGKSIPDIFAQDGEARFRQHEETVVTELGKCTGLVISAGGGLAVNPRNLEALKEHALVVCLWASAETIWQRVRHQTHRPLLHGTDPFSRVCALLAEREPFYRAADVLVNTERRSAREVTQQVVHQFRMARVG